MNINQRISIDRTFLMGLSMVSIMFFHQNFLRFFPFSAFHLCGHFGVDMFFFVSGFGLVYSLNNNTLLFFYIRRLKRLLLPILLCCCLKFILSYTIWPFNLSPRSISSLLAWDLWFFKPLVCFYLLAPYLFRALKPRSYSSIVMATLLICAIFILLFPSLENSVVAWSVARFPAFVLGMAMGKGWTPKVIIKHGWLFALLAIIFRALVVKNYLIVNNLFTYPILTLALPSIAYHISLAGDKIRNKSLYNSVKWCGVISLELYIWHEFIYRIFGEMAINQYCAFVFAIATSLIIAYACHRLLALLLNIFASPVS